MVILLGISQLLTPFCREYLSPMSDIPLSEIWHLEAVSNPITVRTTQICHVSYYIAETVLLYDRFSILLLAIRSCIL